MRRVLLVLGLCLLLPLVPFLLVGELPGDRWLVADDHNALVLGLLGSLLLAADVLLPVPSSVIGTLLGARLGAPLGALFCFIGLMLGVGLGYLLGRLVPQRFAGVLQTPSWPVVFLSRPVPVFAEAVAVAAGVFRVSPHTFFSWAALGNALYAVLLAANGAYQLPQQLIGPGLALPMLLPVLSFFIWRRYQRGTLS